MAATVKKRVTKKAPAASKPRAAAKQREFIDSTTAWVAIFAGLCIVFLLLVALSYLR